MRQRLFKATGIIITASLFSKLLGFAREMMLARYFGASAETDAYLVALIIPTLFFGAIGAGLTTVLIPVYREYLSAGGEQEGQRLANTVVNVVLLILGAFVALGWVFAPHITRLLARGFDESQLQLTVQLSRLMFPMILFLGLSNWTTAVLQARQHFTTPALVGLPYNALLIAGYVLGGLYWGIKGAATATVLACASQYLIQVPGLRREAYKYSPIIDLSHPGLRKVGALIVPIIIGTGAGTVNLAVDRMLASGLVEGSISALNYANRLNFLPYGLSALAVITVLYPSITEFAVEGDRERVAGVVRKGLLLLAFLMIPATLGLYLLSEPLVRLAFERGAFGPEDTQLTAYALLFYSLGLVWAAWRDLISRAFFAFQDTVTPMKVGVIAVVLNVALNLLLVGPLKHGGLALGTSLAAFASVLLLLWAFRKLVPELRLRTMTPGLARMVAASGVMAAVVWWVRNSVFSTGGLLGTYLSRGLGHGTAFDLAGVLATTVAGITVYGGMAWLLRLETMHDLLTTTYDALVRFSTRVKEAREVS